MAKIICSFEPCDRNAYCKSLCQGHYNQQYKGKELTPFVKSRKDFKPKSMGTIPVCAYPDCNERIARRGSPCKFHKRCKSCLETKELTQFTYKYKHYCDICADELKPYRYPLAQIKYRYNLTNEQYEQLLQKQNYLCANPNCNQKPECVDHDHSCCPGNRSCGKCVRGILCNNCNSAEGFLKSDPNLALGLAEYIIMNTKKVVGL